MKRIALQKVEFPVDAPYDTLKKIKCIIKNHNHSMTVEAHCDVVETLTQFRDEVKFSMWCFLAGIHSQDLAVCIPAYSGPDTEVKDDKDFLKFRPLSINGSAFVVIMPDISNRDPSEHAAAVRDDMASLGFMRSRVRRFVEFLYPICNDPNYKDDKNKWMPKDKWNFGELINRRDKKQDALKGLYSAGEWSTIERLNRSVSRALHSMDLPMDIDGGELFIFSSNLINITGDQVLNLFDCEERIEQKNHES